VHARWSERSEGGEGRDCLRRGGTIDTGRRDARATSPAKPIANDIERFTDAVSTGLCARADGAMHFNGKKES
jgi:hypothetical protein